MRQNIRQPRVAEIVTDRAPEDIRQLGFLNGYVLPKLGLLLAGFPDQSFGSIDITRHCNLRCRHCYFDPEAYDSDLSDEQWMARITAFGKSKLPFRTLCSWIGGEPLLRKGLIERARKNFRLNIVVTNGTIPIPDWPDVYFHVSLDGNRATHDAIRGKKGLYDIVKAHADRPELDVTMVYCISRLNQHCIEEVLEEWYRETRVRGFIFDFYTPRKTGHDELWVPWQDRDRLLNQLIELKRRYRDFLAVPAHVYELMKSSNASRVTANCLFERKGFALDPMGRSKKPCMMAPAADCQRCGCIVPFYLACRAERRYIAREILGDMRCALRTLLVRYVPQ